MAVPYLGPDWAQAARQVLAHDPHVAAAVEGMRLRILTVIEGAPADRVGYLLAVLDGGPPDLRFGAGAPPAGIEADLVLRGPYDAFAAVQRGEVGERRAILTGLLRLEGSRLTALRYAGALEVVGAALGAIPCAT